MPGTDIPHDPRADFKNAVRRFIFTWNSHEKFIPVTTGHGILPHWLQWERSIAAFHSKEVNAVYLFILLM